MFSFCLSLSLLHHFFNFLLFPFIRSKAQKREKHFLLIWFFRCNSHHVDFYFSLTNFLFRVVREFTSSAWRRILTDEVWNREMHFFGDRVLEKNPSRSESFLFEKWLKMVSFLELLIVFSYLKH